MTTTEPLEDTRCLTIPQDEWFRFRRLFVGAGRPQLTAERPTMQLGHLDEDALVLKIDPEIPCTLLISDGRAPGAPAGQQSIERRVSVCFVAISLNQGLQLIVKSRPHEMTAHAASEQYGRGLWTASIADITHIEQVV